MLRNIVLALLMANFLVLAWQRWIVPPEVEQPAADPAFKGQQLVLTRRRQPPPAEIPEIPEIAVAEERAECVRLGPFTDPEEADVVARRFREEGRSVKQGSRQGQVWIGHWVQIDGLESSESAAEALDRLAGVGILDAYVVSKSPVYKVSLGVYRIRESADRMAETARQAGLEPLTVDRYRSGMEYWLTIGVDRDGSLDLGQARVDETQILRTENIPCDEDRPDDGGNSSDSLESPPESTESVPE